MLKSRLLTGTLAGLTLCLTAATAARADTDSGPTSGLYAGAAWGRFDLKIDDLDDVGTAINSITHSSDDAWKISLGWRFSPYLAIEGDYVDLGNPHDSFQGSGADGNYRLHLTGFAPFVVGTLPAGPIELFAKAGYLFYDSDLKVNFNQPGSQVIESSHSRSDFIFGGGLGVTFFHHLNVNAEYDVVRVQNARDSDVLWLGAAWRF